MVKTMGEINFIRSVDMPQIANIICNEIDWKPIQRLGLYPVQVNLLGFTYDDKEIPISIIVKYDQELHEAVARHE